MESSKNRQSTNTNDEFFHEEVRILRLMHGQNYCCLYHEKEGRNHCCAFVDKVRNLHLGNGKNCHCCTHEDGRRSRCLHKNCAKKKCEAVCKSSYPERVVHGLG